MDKVDFVFLKKLLCLVICAFGIASAPAIAADTPTIRLLLNRAQSQMQSGHPDVAIATWKQVLASDPNNLQALEGLATIASQSSHQSEAKEYLERLKHAGASSAVITKIQAIAPLPSNDNALREAARLTQAGQYANAMAIYRKLYGNNPPVGEIALTYYDTLAALPAERKHAIEELRRLSQQFQGNERYSITLGRVLTYDAPNRAEGIRILQKYPNSQPAQQALNQAEVWNERSRSVPQTAATTSPTAPITVIASPTSDVALGYRALNADNLASAESHFQSSLAHETAKKDAYAGLGYVRMKQQDFPAAVRAFEQAQQNGNQDSKIAVALETSRFWTLMAGAGQSADNGQVDEALSSYRKALTLKPDNIDALNGFGGILLRAGRAAEAIPYLTQAVRSSGTSPQKTSAWRTLFLAQSQALLQADAIQTAERIPAEQRSRLEQDPEFLSALAADYTATGNQPQAEKLLRQALAPFQNHTAELTAAQRLQYASVLIAVRHYNTAALNYQRILADSPENADAWRGLVNAEHQNGRDAEALASFRQMPSAIASASEKDAGFLTLIASIYQSQGQIDAAREALDRAQKIAPSTNLRMQRASLEMSGGDKSTAVRLYGQLVDENPESTAAWLGWLEALHATGQDREAFRQVSAMPEEISAVLRSDSEFLQTLASIYSSLGDRHHALAALARLDSIYTARGEEIPPAALLQEGWLLLQSSDNVGLARLIQHVSAIDVLTGDQQNQLAQLWVNWAIRRSSALVQAGNASAAEAVLAATLRAFPDNIDVNNTLAGAYLRNGNAKQAVRLYARQDIAKAEEPVCLAAINAAMAANDRNQSEEWLTNTLNRFDHDPKVLELAARFEQQRGDRRKATAYYRAALQASGPPSVDDLLGTVPDETVGVPHSARAELFQMLAPNAAGGLTAQQATASAGNQDDLWPVLPAQHTDTLAAQPIAEQPLLVPVPAQRNRQRTSSKPMSAEDDLLPPLVNQSSPVAQSRALAAMPESSPSRAPSAPFVQLHEPQSSADLTEPFMPSMRSSVLPVSSRRQVMPLEDAPTSLAMLAPVPSEQLAPLPSLTGKSFTPKPMPSPTQQIQQSLEAIESAGSPALGGNSAVGFHSGQPGFDRLTIFGAEIEQSVPIGTGSRLTVITRPVLLEGQAPQANATLQLGSLPLGALPAAQNSAGVGGEFQLRMRSFGAALGYTPYGFLVSNITGRLLVQPDAGPVTFTFERQSIEDSQLSYAGLRDPGSIGPTYAGNIWGGVIANAASLQISRGIANSGWYAQMGGQYITGYHVQKNFRIDGDAGAYWSIWEQPQYGKLTLGMNFFGMHYDNNQRQFTYGNGGYFSPEAYLLSSIPVSFDGIRGTRFHYRLVGALGLQAFQEGSSPFFPLDSFLQNSALGGYSPQRSDIGANYNIEGDTSYLINEHWHVNGFFSLNNTRGYNNDRVGFSLRYAFRPQPLDLENGPTGIGGSRGLRPPVLP